MTQPTPRVSIGLPVYNGERFLARAIDSLLAQDFVDFELVISDNASTDGTGEISRDYAARDPRIRYHRNERNIGAVGNFNRTLDLASGEYFKWAAHDDWCAPQFLGRCVEVLDDDPSTVLCFTAMGVAIRTVAALIRFAFVGVHPRPLVALRVPWRPWWKNRTSGSCLMQPSRLSSPIRVRSSSGAFGRPSPCWRRVRDRISPNTGLVQSTRDHRMAWKRVRGCTEAAPSTSSRWIRNTLPSASAPPARGSAVAVALERCGQGCAHDGSAGVLRGAADPLEAPGPAEAAPGGCGAGLGRGLERGILVIGAGRR